MPAGIFGSARKPPEKKPAFFGEGGAGRNIAGHIGDALLQYSGMRPIYGPNQQFAREFSAAQAMENQKALARRSEALMDRAGKREDKKWEWENEPEKPTNAQLEYEWYETLTPEQKRIYDQFKPVIASTWQGPVPVPRESLGPQVLGNELPPGWEIDGQANIPSGSPLDPMNAILEHARSKSPSYTGGR